MKKNYLLLIISFLFTFTFLGQTSLEKHISISNHIKNRQFNRIWESKNIFHHEIVAKQKSSLKIKADKTKKLDSVAHHNWDDSTNQWKYEYYEKYLYDVESNLVQYIFYVQNEVNNQWNGVYKEEYTYDAENNLLKSIGFVWNETSNQWASGEKYEYNYNTNSNLIESIDYVWNETNNQWDGESKEEYNYDTDSYLVQVLHYDWNATDNKWDDFRKIEYTYDTNRNLIQILVHEWNSGVNQWEISYKEENTYDTNGDLIQNILFRLIKSTNQWSNIDKGEYNHDTNGDLTQVIDYDWNESANQWENNYTDEFTYDNTYSSTDLIVPPGYSYYSTEFDTRTYFKHMITTWVGYRRNETSNEMVNNYIAEFYYSDISSNQTTTILDANFEQALIDLGIISDSSVDGSVITSEIAAITSLDISGRNISDLAGIEDFTNLETLIVSDNQLTSLDLSNNTNLIFLDASNNPLTTIVLTSDDAAKSSDIKDSQQAMFAPNNNILNIDIVETELVTVGISNTPNLESLNAQGSKLTTLDVSNNDNLDVLNITNNPITCVQVNQTQLDNIPTGWEKDTIATYHTDCQSYLGIDNELLEKSINLYPNPVSDILTIDSKLQITKIEIYSILGEKVKEIGKNYNSIPLNNLNHGIYLLRIESENGFTVKKLIKQ